MARILNIETSTEICSVAISENGVCTALKISDNTLIHDQKSGSHSKLLAIFIKEILDENKLIPKDLDAVAISAGPGSYTGLRIGVSTVKGFCFGADIPLIAINTLQLIAAMVKQKTNENYNFYIPMIDAKRMEVYCALFDNNLNMNGNIEAKIIDENSFAELKNQKTVICGNGAEKCKIILQDSNFSFSENTYPSAEYMGSFAEIAFLENNFVDLVYFEPYYLKDFIATTPKNKFITN
jgi:tRNA threonylcarbamoyladenosine biosynthesis protein TsaB